MWYWLFKYVLVGPALRAVGRPSVQGLEQVPRTGPAILASNHLAVIDSLFLALVIPRRITFVAKKEHFTGRGVTGRATAWFYTVSGQVPIDRSDSRAARIALDAAESILRRGGVWGIYPEGSRSPDGALGRGKTGVVRVAAATGAPVFPVLMRGTDRINPVGSRLWRPGKVHITIGAPMYFFDAHGDRAAVRTDTNSLMARLASMQ